MKLRRPPQRTSAVIGAYQDVMRKHPRFANRLGEVGADPWLIAYARARGWGIITEELPAALARTQKRRPKIPDVCDDLGVACVSLKSLASIYEW